ncbi:MAG: ligase-associated DNA damage response endonuclease PdeM [Bosea sp. (in: a-proteobacteria)]|uniref:ligase-associated DNA damage response endonuclease PdeM n=1 Tax=Bosea sp. (in: a-proteobacteria) TaxID=1871050 RepID=UPI002736C52F|nr:ligase-associated DNA damage response endonuclease PdeM [Bosea sp. (in: a-proteobacteria)]MDP3258021.1 ligase-associated DNA damage response endonuclease PdeM [Bosea sp. (in: a-proteobacteria)]MDP3320211.1 ligase-associated DNA damage response endonuclease PdeM [Bosea sp. (in: a-proteobacteria)]
MAGDGAATEAAFLLGRLVVVPDRSGALWLPEERTLVVADLHLEKGSSYARRGVFLPPYDSAATLASLAAAVTRHAPARIIALGDSFHDRDAGERFGGAERATLAALQAGRDWIWVTGNHDPQIGGGLGGEVVASLSLAGVTLRHEPDAAEAGFEIAGHLHPAAKLRLRGRALRRRCFALSARRCVLPAMGAYAGGLNLRDEAFRPLLGTGFSAHLLGDARLFRIDPRLLLPD